MPWSTSELAGLAGTTLNTIRHYHRLGLLDEPKRLHNGYKQYEVAHLVSLLRIRRLVALGMPLSEIPGVRAGESDASEILRSVDAELQTKIDRLQQARREIALILSNGAPADAPAGFESVASRLSEADSSMIHVYTQMYSDALADIHQMAEDDATDLSAEIDGLPADAGEDTRRDLIDRLAPTLAQHLIDYPWLGDPASRLSKGGSGTSETFIEAVRELYNPAQLDVLGRASLLAQEQVRALRNQVGQETPGPTD